MADNHEQKYKDDDNVNNVIQLATVNQFKLGTFDNKMEFIIFISIGVFPLTWHVTVRFWHMNRLE